jgi:hypothetical protein
MRQAQVLRPRHAPPVRCGAVRCGVVLSTIEDEREIIYRETMNAPMNLWFPAKKT